MNAPSSASFLGVALTRSLLVVTPPPTATPHHSPHLANMEQEPPTPPHFPYMASLNLPYLSRLIDSPIAHDPAWPAMSTKLPLDIPKFKGQETKDLANHIMSFHVSCSSNNIIEDLVHLCLFQRTLMGSSTRRYVKEQNETYDTF